MNLKTEILKTCEFSIGNNVNHENIISYIVNSNVHEKKLIQTDEMIMICMYRLPRS